MDELIGEVIWKQGELFGAGQFDMKTADWPYGNALFLALEEFYGKRVRITITTLDDDGINRFIQE